jgi:hypothetical protein
MIEYAKGFDLAAAVERDYRDPKARPMEARERAAALRLIPQLQHRQQLPGGHCPLVIWHEDDCASRKGGECDCRVLIEIDLPGRN